MEAKPPATILWLWVKTRQNPSILTKTAGNSTPQVIILMVIYIYTIYDNIYIYKIQYMIYVLYNYTGMVLYSIIPPFLGKSSSNQCLGLCKALGFLLPLHLRPYPRSLVVERWFSDMATLTHGTSSIVNLPG